MKHVAAALLLLGACSQSEQNDTAPTDMASADAEGESLTQSRDGPAPEGESIPVPSDPKASYRLLDWSKISNGNLEATTRRDGPSGTSYARREIDCDARTFRYLGEGDTLEAAKADGPNPGEMGELTEESISTYVSNFVCHKAAR